MLQIFSFIAVSTEFDHVYLRICNTAVVFLMQQSIEADSLADATNVLILQKLSLGTAYNLKNTVLRKCNN